MVHPRLELQQSGSGVPVLHHHLCFLSHRRVMHSHYWSSQCHGGSPGKYPFFLPPHPTKCITTKSTAAPYICKAYLTSFDPHNNPGLGHGYSLHFTTQLRGVEELATNHQLGSGRAGLLLQLLESQSWAPSTMCYKPRETQQTLYDRAGSCWFLFRNQYYTATMQDMLFFLYQFVFTLVYPVQPGLSMTRYWIGGWVRNKNQTGLRGARTPLPSSKRGEMGLQEEPFLYNKATSCPVFYLFSGSPRVEWTLLSLPPKGGRVVRNWTQASLECRTCQQWSH